MYSHIPNTKPSNFTATLLQEEGGTPIVSAFGEIDIRTVHDLDVLMMEAVSKVGGGAHVIVDLDGVEFMDCSGLKALIRARSVLAESGGALAVVCGSYIRRLFEAAGLVENFELHEDLASAVERRPGLRYVP